MHELKRTATLEISNGMAMTTDTACLPTFLHMLSKGDTIITSGNSFIFPEGVLIGTVDEYESKAGEKFGSARVRFSVDFNKLYYVYVITNLLVEEQLSLEPDVNDND
ncbi:MAG: rod shape-determining protein MreC [Bacteroidales bacterium]